MMLGILILLAILLFPRPEPVPVTPSATSPVSLTDGGIQPQPVPEQPVIPAPNEVVPEPTDSVQADGTTSLPRLAASFAERYGSYSNHNDFENLKDLEVLMSDRLAAETESYIIDQLAGGTLSEYVGVSTRALKSEVVSFSDEDGGAEVTVSTQRSYSDGRLVFQNLYLNFVKSGEQWLVSSVNWDDVQENAR